MKAYLLTLGVMLRAYFSSAKVLTALMTTLAEWLIKNPELRLHVLAVGALLLAAQAANDHGKAAALINAAAPKAAQVVAVMPVAGGPSASESGVVSASVPVTLAPLVATTMPPPTSTP